MMPSATYLIKETNELVGKFEAQRRVRWLAVGSTITIQKVYPDE